MKEILRIQRHDLRAVTRSFFAILILIAVAILPALYAWVNIYANMDPYGSTGNIRIAVASRDSGIVDANGATVNKAQEVMDELRESTAIGWQFPDSADDAIEGVRSGEYYAAIIFEKNFTYNMYHFEHAVSDAEVPVTYYENAKKNAVASKITQTAASSLQEKINTKYLQTVFSTIFSEANGIESRLQSEDAIQSVILELTELRDTLLRYDMAVEQFLSVSPETSAALQSAQSKLETLQVPDGAKLTTAQQNLARAQQTVAALDMSFSQKLSDVETKIADVEAATQELKNSNAVKRASERVDSLREKNQVLLATLQSLRALLDDRLALPGVQSAAAALDSMILRAEGIESLLSALPEGADVSAVEQLGTDVTALCQSMRSSLSNTLVPGVNTMLSDFSATLAALTPLLSSVNGMLANLSGVTAAAGDAITDIDAALWQLRSVLQGAAGKLTEVIDTVQSTEGDQRLEMLLHILGGDADLYGNFFSALSDVDVQEVYSVKSYGAAMAPFYSVLAVWVGGVILVSILDTHTDEKKFPRATNAQQYFGRFGIFLLMGQIQAAVIVLGDIFLLDCAPVHPWLMWLSAAVASFVFVLLIYSLTISFGDIGKAIVVVIMVVQIAGSSGSYPIEILPEIFAKIYRFFPFPYAINAMREALCGIYGQDYLVYLLELLLFGALALLIGLVVRRPFLNVNHFVSEKLEETGVI